MKRREKKPEPPTTPQKSSNQRPSKSSGHKTSVRKGTTNSGNLASPEMDNFDARQSRHVSSTKYSHDGDSWQETLAVCEVPSKDGTSAKMTIRSYYVNLRTSERVWDEPPSGASHILPATEEMRKMADVQLQEMQISFGNLVSPVTTDQKKRGLFRRSPKPETPTGKIQYKPGSFLSRVRKQSSPPQKPKHDETLDPDVQRAIALSMIEGTSTRPDKKERHASSEPESAKLRDDEDALAMAMALSASEANTKYTPLSEEEMFQRALEESKRPSKAASNVARAPPSLNDGYILDEADLLALSLSSKDSSENKPCDDLSDQKMPAKPSSRARKAAPDTELDQKMPAKPRSRKAAPDNELDQKMPAKSSSRKAASDNALDQKMPAKSSSRSRKAASDNESEQKMSAKPSSWARKAAPDSDSDRNMPAKSSSRVGERKEPAVVKDSSVRKSLSGSANGGSKRHVGKNKTPVSSENVEGTQSLQKSERKSNGSGKIPRASSKKALQGKAGVA